MLLVLLSMSLASEPVDDQSTERRTVGSKIPIGALHPSISPEILRQTLQLQSTDDYASVQKLGVALRNSGFNHTAVDRALRWSGLLRSSDMYLRPNMPRLLDAYRRAHRHLSPLPPNIGGALPLLELLVLGRTVSRAAIQAAVGVSALSTLLQLEVVQAVYDHQERSKRCNAGTKSGQKGVSTEEQNDMHFEKVEETEREKKDEDEYEPQGQGQETERNEIRRQDYHEQLAKDVKDKMVDEQEQECLVVDKAENNVQLVAVVQLLPLPHGGLIAADWQVANGILIGLGIEPVMPPGADSLALSALFAARLHRWCSPTPELHNASDTHLPLQTPAVLDLCSGGGVQAVTAALACSSATVVLVDISTRAARFARFNLHLNGIAQNRASIYTGDLYVALPEKLQFSLVVANPPFVPNPGDCSDCAPGALFGNGGHQGDAVLQRILRGARNVLRQSSASAEVWAVGTVALATCLHDGDAQTVASEVQRKIEGWWAEEIPTDASDGTQSLRHNRTSWTAQLGLSRWRSAREYAAIYEGGGLDSSFAEEYAAKLVSVGVSQIAMDAVVIVAQCSTGGDKGLDQKCRSQGSSREKPGYMRLYVNHCQLEQLWSETLLWEERSLPAYRKDDERGLWDIMASQAHSASVMPLLQTWPCTRCTDASHRELLDFQR